MDRVTLIVVPDGQSRVRRVQVPRALLRWGVPGVVVAALVFGALAADWARLRLAGHDVAAMRAKTGHDQQTLAHLAQELRTLEEKLGRLVEFERKVRVIADLPAALPETDAPSQLGASRPQGGGQGGAEEPEEAAAGEGAEVSAPAPPAPADPPAAHRGLGLDDAAVRRIQDKADRLAARIEVHGGAFEQLIAKLGEVRDRLASTPSIWPTDGWVTSGFGWRISPFTGRRQFHSGLDISADVGTDIVAAARGRVVFAGTKGALGRTVMVDHGFGLRTLYGHASVVHVHVGDLVERGQRLAAVGSSGRSTGPHLHYGVSLQGRNVDPTNYVLE
jgi:murein DD-endopeptidase MepM/ murein hydrolase activator NlpD